MVENITNVINNTVSLLNGFGIFSGFILVFLESIVPILPVSVFIALNVVTYGSVIGFVISWIATVLGCMTSFYISRKFSNYINKKFKHNKKIKQFRKYIDKLSFSNLVILFAIPFAPAFAVNIAAGISSMDKKRFFVALGIGKIPMVYFWGFIGKNVTESLTDISVLAKMIFMIIMAYLVGKVANKFIKE